MFKPALCTLWPISFFKQSPWSGVILRQVASGVWSSFGCGRGSWSTCSGRSHETSAEAAFARASYLDRNHGCGQLRCPTIAHFPLDWRPCLLLPQPFFLTKPTNYDSELWNDLDFCLTVMGVSPVGNLKETPKWLSHMLRITMATLFICGIPVTALSPKAGASPFIVTTNQIPPPPFFLHHFYE